MFFLLNSHDGFFVIHRRQGPGCSRGGHRPATTTDLAASHRHRARVAGEADAAVNGEGDVGSTVVSTRGVGDFLGIYMGI